MDWKWIILILFILAVIRARVKKRGYFWRDRKGKKVKTKEFFKRWKDGVNGITPLQQVKTTLWSFPLIIGGLITGIVISIINKSWWLVLILSGSLPITLMQIVSTYQKYRAIKRVEEAMKEAMENDE
ncbi:hypothetical protein BMS3Abin17_00109 [archaeon BMS3Abin17]|nr:hypothetical protein BMS3Abin17_00109 [archaeon BMS3Abin17]HDZ60149.1 hypothetical protein [Candidatus Pacearchaeota archaeon]